MPDAGRGQPLADAAAGRLAHVAIAGGALAEWITDTEHGAGQLLARVIVNRLWQHHMGRGIVATPSDFGSRGERPTHPELLDYLARELIKNGWRLKPIHKLIMTSAVYQQGSRLDAAKAKVDHDNKLWWRFLPRRLEAEVIRDCLLAVSGQLDEKMYGPGTLDEKSQRRSIYFTVKRSKLMPMMVIFDAPEALQRHGRTADHDHRAAGAAPDEQPAGARIRPRLRPARCAERGDSAGGRAAAGVSHGARARSEHGGIARWAGVFGRADGELSARAAALAALTDFCQVLMCLNEFIYVD